MLLLLLAPLRIYLKHIDRQPALPAEPCIVASNHASPLDAPLLMLALGRRLRFVAAGHLRTTAHPPLRLLWHWFGLFLIGRSIPSGIGGLARCERALRHGASIGIFPQGDIHPGWRSERERIHTGTVALSHLVQVPILPVRIVGSESVWPMAGPFRFWRIRTVRIVVGSTLQPPPPSSKLDYQAASTRLIARIKSLQ